jgi:hypothetical protein
LLLHRRTFYAARKPRARDEEARKIPGT